MRRGKLGRISSQTKWLCPSMWFLGMRRHTVDIFYCLENYDVLCSPLVAKVLRIEIFTLLS